MDVRIAVVSYKDHGDRDNLVYIDFTTSADSVRSYIGRLTASGGAYIPEDVLGGIQGALHMSWKQQNRCIIHIADAPAHERKLNTCSDVSGRRLGGLKDATTTQKLQASAYSITM